MYGALNVTIIIVFLICDTFALAPHYSYTELSNCHSANVVYQGCMKRRGHATHNACILCMRRIIDESAGYAIFSHDLANRPLGNKGYSQSTCNTFFTIF